MITSAVNHKSLSNDIEINIECTCSDSDDIDETVVYKFSRPHTEAIEKHQYNELLQLVYKCRSYNKYAYNRAKSRNQIQRDIETLKQLISDMDLKNDNKEEKNKEEEEEENNISPEITNLYKFCHTMDTHTYRVIKTQQEQFHELCTLHTVTKNVLHNLSQHSSTIYMNVPFISMEEFCHNTEYNLDKIYTHLKNMSDSVHHMMMPSEPKTYIELLEEVIDMYHRLSMLLLVNLDQ
jgi:hypothetical protein